METLPVLMTASVSTRGMKGACFEDSEREAMYAGALSFYIENLLKDKRQRIVFAENSGWDLKNIEARLPEHNARQIEFLSVPAELFDISKGKGYNELLLINEAVKRSRVLQNSGAFFKVTGRYPIYNLSYFLKCANRLMRGDRVKLYADIKDHSLYDWLHLGWCGHSFECRLFAVEKQYYMDNIAPLYAECDDYSGNLLEKILFGYVKQCQNRGGGKSAFAFQESRISAA